MTDNILIAEVSPHEEEQGSALHEAPLAENNASSTGGDTADAKLSNAAPVQYGDFQMPEGVSQDAQAITEGEFGAGRPAVAMRWSRSLEKGFDQQRDHTGCNHA